MKYMLYMFLLFFFMGVAGGSPLPYWEIALIAGAWTIGISAIAVLLRKYKII